MSKPSHRAAAEINKRARRHYPRLKAEMDSHATDTAPYVNALAEAAETDDDDLSVANIEGGWSGHKSDLDWPIEHDDPWMLGLGVAAVVVIGVGALTLLGGIGFGLWSLGVLLFHSLD